MPAAARPFITALVILLVAAGPAGAQGEQTLTCAFESRVALDPGVTLTPAQGTYQGDGVARCAGVYDGERVDGSGSITYEGLGGSSGPIAEQFGGDTCLLGSGTGTVEVQIESVEGTAVAIQAQYDLVRIGVVGYATGDQLAATFQFIPDVGPDCVYTEIREATVRGQALFSDVL
ncbi:MAG TPA: hypothetical protein VGB52_00740 [Actinomycetota bacterium]